MRIAQDVPGRALVLEGIEPRAYAEMGCALLCLLPLVGFALIPGILSSFRGAIGLLFLLGLFFVVVLVLLRRQRTVSFLSVDRNQQRCQVVERSVLPFFVRRRSIPLSEMTAIQLSTDHDPPFGGRSGRPLVFQVEQANDRRMSTSGFRIFVREVVGREEVGNLALRIGAIIGLTHYAARDLGVNGFSIRVTRGVETGSLAVPMLDAEAAPIAPLTGAAPYDPCVPVGTYVALDWSPGRRVELVRRFYRGLFMRGSLVATAGAGIVALLLWRGGSLTTPGGGLSLTPVLFVLAGEALGLVLSTWFSRPHRTVIDWTAHTVSVGGWGRKRTMRLEEVVAVELRGDRRHSTMGDVKNTLYRCQVRLDARGGGLLAAQTEWHREDPHTPYDNALPLAVDLSRALGVPYRSTDYR